MSEISTQEQRETLEQMIQMLKTEIDKLRDDYDMLCVNFLKIEYDLKWKKSILKKLEKDLENEKWINGE